MLVHAIYIFWFFALGACVGSFLNVVVWRLPRGESLVTPPSHCPKCNARLRWYDNIPVIGWLKLHGKCRYCAQPISPRYPIIEAITGLMFVGYYVAFFIFQQGPCPLGTKPPSGYILAIQRDWPIYLLCMFTLSALLAASLIDAENFFIPQSIPLVIAIVGLLYHAFLDTTGSLKHPPPGAVNVTATPAALAAGAGVGLLLSLGLKLVGWLPISFEHGWPLMEHEREEMRKEIAQLKREGKEAPDLPPLWSRKEINREMRKEMLFLIPPMALGILWVLLTWKVDLVQRMWERSMSQDWLTGLLGSLLGALVGGFIVWLTRILGSVAFGREAMGMGDVDLMFGIGAVIGAGAVTVTFFVAPFFGLAIAVYMIITGTRRELPYGPYLSLATAFIMLYYCDVKRWLGPGFETMIKVLFHPSTPIQ
jgi:leader peptidase (prepilin peptidase)/N-methyltransferase